MYVLGIETSCDETSIALLFFREDTYQRSFYAKINSAKLIVNIVSSQVNIHKEYGGVIPELGAREHAKNIFFVFNQVLQKAENILKQDRSKILKNITNIYVTTKPGLASSLRVGREFAKSLKFFISNELKAKTLNVFSVNHLSGHLASSFYDYSNNFYKINKKNQNFIDEYIFPHLHLLVSGGHTQLIYYKNPKSIKIIGETLDDAAGECFDKIGRMLGLGYPGGVLISKIANKKIDNTLDLPVGLKSNQSYNFSYSGLKTAARYLVQKQSFKNWNFEESLDIEDINQLIKQDEKDLQKDYLKFIKKACISAQSVIVKQLINKSNKAIADFQPKSIGLSGGVSANPLLRQELKKNFDGLVFFPDKNLTGDNGVMIALAGVMNIPE